MVRWMVDSILDFFSHFRIPPCTSWRVWLSWTMMGIGFSQSISTPILSQQSKNKRHSKRISFPKHIGPIPKLSCSMGSLASTRVTWTSSFTSWDLQMTMRYTNKFRIFFILTRHCYIYILIWFVTYPGNCSFVVGASHRFTLPLRLHQSNIEEERWEAELDGKLGCCYARHGWNLRWRV